MVRIGVVVGVLAAIVVPLSTGQLRYSAWFAVQRVDLIFAPVLVGCYWGRQRPGSRFAWMLVALGSLAIPLSLEAISSPWPHLIGVMAEAPLLYATFVVILAFPTGRLGGVERGVLVMLFVGFLAWYVPYFLLAPVTPGSPLAVCAHACPSNPLHVAGRSGTLATLGDIYSGIALAVTVAVGVIVMLRLARADPPRRRALLIGSVVAMMFLAAFALYVAANLFTSLLASAVETPVRWLLPAFRAALPLGYLAALIDAELHAGRVMTGIVDRALRSSSTFDVIRALPQALGDPQLAFGFWVQGRGWLRADGEPFAEPAPGSGRVITTVDREGRPLAAVVHRAQLEESPELINAMVAASLLIVENASLEAELRATIAELRESRARLIRAGDAERRRIERDLHDGAQQRLIALRMKLQSSGETPSGSRADRGNLAALCTDVDRALAEIRELAQGIFPRLLADRGLVAAVQVAALNSPLSVRVQSAMSVPRYALDLEAALYFCAVEALQNAAKHAGAAAQVMVTVSDAGGELWICVRDDGVGFDPQRAGGGSGLAGMRERLGAFGGRLTIEAARGRGTMVHGAVRVAGEPAAAPEPERASGR